MRNRWWCCLVSAILILASWISTGCFSGSGTPQRPEVSTKNLTIHDSTGRTVVLPEKPEKVVVLSPSFLDLLYAVDGKAAGRPSSRTAIPDAALAVPEVGFVYNINLEQVTALHPDVVIGVQGMHEKLIASLESSHIPVIILRYKTLDDTYSVIRIFGSIAGTQAKAEQVIAAMQTRIQALTAKLPADRNPKIAILHATAKDVTVERETTIAGSVAKMLGLLNVVAAGSTNAGAENVPYSLEKLVEADPDMIFVVTMGEKEELQKRMQTDVESNPAWASLRSVQQKKVYFLPSGLFLLNPGLRLPETVEYMAKLAYPEVYGSAK